MALIRKEKNITPRYGQQLFDKSDRQNRFQTLVSPDKGSGAIWINQDAWFSMADLNSGTSLDYHKHRTETGLYFFVISGQVVIEGHELEQRDGLGLSEGKDVQISAQSHSELLCIEVPMA